MHTEAEAKEKWCPFDQRSVVYDSVRCRASGCMAWRWVTGVQLVAIEMSRKEDNLHVGYCGLAGGM